MLSEGRTLDQLLVILTSIHGISYKGFNKLEYENVINALLTIIKSKKLHLRRNSKQKEAIAFLHQEVKFSPNLIQNILRLFKVKQEVSTILKASYNVFVKNPPPKWLQNIRGDNL